MPVARVYIPGGAADLALLRARGALPPGTLGVAVAPGGSEEAEQAAWLHAAEEAGERGQERRVVISADIDVDQVTPEATKEATSVALQAALPLSRVVAFHVDERPGAPVADLLWYDATEFDAVLALVSAP